MNTTNRLIHSVALQASLYLDSNTSTPIWFTHIINSYLAGQSALPPYLGLKIDDYQQLLAITGCTDNPIEHDAQARLIRQELNLLRQSEQQELIQLLQPYASKDEEYLTSLTVTIISHASLGGQHLWHDLGLPNRDELSKMMRFHFPELFALNDKNMRWKRFFYRQMCQQGGDYVCRSPSCENCSSYEECFAPS